MGQTVDLNDERRRIAAVFPQQAPSNATAKNSTTVSVNTYTFTNTALEVLTLPQTLIMFPARLAVAVA